MKNSKFFIFPIIFSTLLVSCSNKKTSFYFDTYVTISLLEGKKKDVENIENIFSKLDKLTDNYNSRDLNNVYTINHTNDWVEVDPDLFNLLKKSIPQNEHDLKSFNPLCGSLSKKWKDSLTNNEILSNEIITSELEKMNSTYVEFSENNKVRRIGEGEIDLGGAAKGYAIDKVKEYLVSKGYKKYLVDAGSSSILLGEKKGGKDYVVKISDLDNAYLSLKNCFVSTSSFSTQKVEIDGVNYSHIIDPITGSAINKHDAVIVVSETGLIGDILSTAFVNESLDSIKEIEQIYNVKSIVIKDKTIIYKNDGLEVTQK